MSVFPPGYSMTEGMILTQAGPAAHFEIHCSAGKLVGVRDVLHRYFDEDPEKYRNEVQQDFVHEVVTHAEYARMAAAGAKNGLDCACEGR